MAQGTGRHPHKSSKEPYSHSKGSSGGNKMQASPRDGGGSQSASGDMKGREYRDAKGGVHHHTKTYMEQHGKDRGR